MTIQIFFKQGEVELNVYESFYEIIKLKDYDKIKYILCRNCNLINLPPLPKNLLGLYCENNIITELPDLPNTLKELRCSYNQLESLPKLPYNLQELYCTGNNLKSLPELVYNNFHKLGITDTDEYMEGCSIRKIFCSKNKIESFSKFPFTLTELDCSHNNISKFPELPQMINSLDISYNNLTSLPTNLTRLEFLLSINFSNNQITTSIPWFTDNLNVLICNNNPISHVSYILLKNLRKLNCSLTNLKTIPNCPSGLNHITTNEELFNYINENFPEKNFRTPQTDEY